MDSQLLKCFLALEAYQNFSSAAYECHMTQSSLSKKIKQLESVLGVTLFNRNTRLLELTEAGSIFKTYAQEAIKNEQNLMSQLKPYQKSNPQFTIGSIPILNQYGFSVRLANMQTKNQNLQLEIKEFEHLELMKALDQKQIEIAMTRLENIDQSIYHTVPLMQDELVYVCSKNHSNALKTEMSLEQLKDEPLILLGPSSGVYQTCHKLFQTTKVQPRMIQTHYKIETILGLVSANLGGSLLMKQSLQCFNLQGINVMPVHPHVQSQIGLVYLKGIQPSQIMTEFISNMQISI